ncbi:MarR family winged helix-turn-helix transcriptional regulator [Pseudonocardia sichuanensis]
MSTSAWISAATGYLMFRVGDAARDRIEQELAQWGLAGKELRVLAFAHEGACSQQDLTRLTGMDRTTMVAVVDKLERLGYARRERSAADRRKYVVAVTGAGADALGAAAARLAAAEAEFLAPLDADERRQLNGFLVRLHAAHDPACPSADHGI